MGDSIEPQGLHSEVLAQLGPAIVDGQHPPGTVLRLDEMERRFAVSRTVVREAVRVLESMRMVTSRRRVGVTVRPRGDWSLYDPLVVRWRLAGTGRTEQLRSLTELRSAVEPAAAQLAATRAQPEQCGELVRITAELATTARARDLRAFLGHDIAFHHTVLLASGNEMFSRLSDAVAEVLTGRTEHDLMPEEPDPDAVRLHSDVADAIQAGDGAAAEAAMRAIVRGAHREMGAVLGFSE